MKQLFVKQKKEMFSDRFLTHFDPDLPIKLVCDASQKGIGAVLLHIFPDKSERPICYTSRVFRKSEKNILLYTKRRWRFIGVLTPFINF